MAEVIESLRSKHKSLTSNPSNQKKGRKKGREGRKKEKKKKKYWLKTTQICEEKWTDKHIKFKCF
jgi:hypothetical protein